MDYRVRPFTLADSEAVKALCDWAWWPHRSLAGWRWLIGGAPGAAFTEDLPPGWVCETPDGRVLAFLGNFLQRYDYSGETLIGATLHTLLVDPAVKGASRDLLRRFAAQDLPFVRSTFNANDRSAPIYKHFAMHPWRQTPSAAKYVWRTDWRGVATERALRWFNGLSGHQASRAGGERFLDPRLWTGVLGHCEPGVAPLSVADIDERFDLLWKDLRGDGRLLAARDAASLRWRCADPDLTREPVMLTWESDGRLAGYLLAFFSKGSEVERPALEIIDLIAVAGHEAVAVPALLRTLLGSARELGAARVRLPVVNERLETLLTPFRAARRVYGHDHCHARWAEGAEAMAPDWFATPFDGDYSFCLRPPPRLTVQRVA